MSFSSPEFMVFLSFSILAYCMGSLPFGVWISRLIGQVSDIRRVGSGNIGATNVWRAAGKKAAALTFICDALKSFLPTYWALKAGVPEAFWIGAISVTGHVFPVFLRFKGGKGISSTIGMLVAFSPFLALFVFVVWCSILSVTRYVSVASLGAVLAAPIGFYMIGCPSLSISFVPLAILLFWTHRHNLHRLLTQMEPRVGSKTHVA